ncbi:hypothetical protein [Gluconacetobacter liquefaciens]|uniref:Uncharacterized protein n=2 Tax=Gluconacetobacter liquefaciens TaxID=89584 RepID=A0A7W4JJB7_GLULI|nr:hypothetical protein [Gluconacetobacter liquefaciens]MBB2185809.1 hypothetical protein [Gluconacetobacter liquefaciens]
MRGRVMALRVGVGLGMALGGTPIDAPIIHWVANTFGPRWALGIGAVGRLTVLNDEPVHGAIQALTDLPSEHGRTIARADGRQFRRGAVHGR